MTKRLDGKVAVITGTGGGQGRAAALLFAQEGAIVVGADVKVQEGQETADLVRAAGGRMTSAHPLDIGEQDAVRAWIDGAAAEHGRIDIVYNNAGGPKFVPFADMTGEEWEFTIRNELDQVFYVTQAAWPHLIAAGGGTIVTTASIQGAPAVPPTVGGFAHAAAKQGLIGLTRELAAEGSPHGIRANAISPGLIMSPGTASWVATMPEYLATFLDRQLVKRPGQPEDIARAALFLASDDSSWITGQNLVVDGGYTAV